MAGNSTASQGQGGDLYISAGAAFGNSSCSDIEYECGSETLTSATYEAIRKGCDRGDLYGLTSSGFTCQGVSVTQTQFDAAQGRCTQKCLGGAVEIAAGYSNGGHGGHVRLSGGDVVVRSEMSGPTGVSGAVSVQTGTASNGPGGGIALSVGKGDTGAGGDVDLAAGETTADDSAGGSVSVAAGDGTSSSGGAGGDLSVAAGNAVGG